MKFSEINESFGLTKWTIMNAKSVFDNKKVNIQDIMYFWNVSVMTIMVVKKGTIPTFVVGSAGEYGNVGDKVGMTIDTGMGNRKTNTIITIENIIKFNHGKIIKSVNNIGLKEKRDVWVFK